MSPKLISLFVACVVVFGVLDALPLDSGSSSVMENLETQENAFAVKPSNEGKELVRDKRTIGFLRQLFPGLSQIIDRKIQAITRVIFRLIGRLVLRGAAGGGGGGGGTDSDSSDGDNGRRISITLPTFPPSADDEEEEDTTDSDSSTPGSDSSLDDSSTTTTTEPSDSDNTVSESKVAPVLVRKARQAQAEEEEDDDQAAEATGDNELGDSDDSDTAASVEGTDDPRDKRLVNFNLGGGSGGSGGGSGNFLFDIIRLVAGSGTSQAEDEANNAPLEDGQEAAKGDDGYSAAVPGPLTRLFVIANRGIANLIQDLILRLAQTSERIVNFKARLITSII